MNSKVIITLSKNNKNIKKLHKKSLINTNGNE